jgi:hypothetical protein
LNLIPGVHTKVVQCRNRFTKKEDWVYCTKFGAATTGKVRVRMRAKFLAKHSASVNIQVAVYKDKEFEAIMASEEKSKMGCKEKRD